MISPLKAIIRPAIRKAEVYDLVKSYIKPVDGESTEMINHIGSEQQCRQHLPPMGAPIKLAIPWKRSSKPKAFVSFSRPSRSTSITEVRPT